MIGSKEWMRVPLGAAVRHKANGTLMRVAGRYQDRDGSVRILCRWSSDADAGGPHEEKFSATELDTAS